MFRGPALFAAVAVLSSCASTSSRGSFDTVSQLVAERTGQSLQWRTGGPEDEAVARRVREILGSELTPASAVQVALLDNHDLVATYEDLAVAQADLVQAGLLRNPTLGGAVLFPSSGGHVISTDFSVVEDFLDLFILPLRKRMARAELRAAELRVGSRVLAVAFEVEEAYYRLQAARQIRELRQSVADAEAEAAELRRRQHEAGNIGDLEFVTQEALDQQARLELLRSDQACAEASERLTQLLGVAEAPPDGGWKLAPELPSLPAEDPLLSSLTGGAETRRLDLQLAHRETEALRRALSLTQVTRWFGVLQFGASSERDAEGIRVTGPEVVIEVPVFDQRQAAVARLEALLRAQQERQRQAEVKARSEVRLAHGRMLAARAVAERYQRVLIPLRAQAVVLSQRHYDAMLLGVFGLLQARQAEVNARREQVEALRDYWIARAELKQAVGGEWPAAVSPITSSKVHP